MSVHLPIAKLSLVYSRGDAQRNEQDIARRRFLVWLSGLLIAAAIYFGVPAFFAWKHVISASGGKYFVHRIVHPVPPMEQNDPRWTFQLLGPTADTIGQTGCAITSASMVLASYGIDVDPGRLNQYLNSHEGYTREGWVFWEKASDFAPGGQVEKAYEDLPSYALLDQNILEGNPVIIRLKLHNGTTHFVVVVGKEGWNYLIEDPARSVTWGVYPLSKITERIEALRFYRFDPSKRPPPPPAPPKLIGPPLPAYFVPPTDIAPVEPVPAAKPARKKHHE